MQVSDFQCIRPFGLRGKWPPDHQHVSSSPSKIPYSGFSPVRLQTGFQPRPSSTLPNLSARPAFPLTGRIYTQLKSLSQKEAVFRPRTCVQSGLCPSRECLQSMGPRSPAAVLSRRRRFLFPGASFSSPPAGLRLSGRFLRDGLVSGCTGRKVPNLSRSSFPSCHLPYPGGWATAPGYCFIAHSGLPHLRKRSASAPSRWPHCSRESVLSRG